MKLAAIPEKRGGARAPERAVAPALAALAGAAVVAGLLIQRDGPARWALAAVALAALALLAGSVVFRQTAADRRAHRFLELSRDLLCTFDRDGNAVELNSAWEDCLGYSAEELRAARPFELLHPDERERSERGVASLFEGAEGVGFENRYLAKDGSWRWLSWTASLAAEESLVYARATDVTKLKRVESERENLLTEVAVLARSDTLTGLPNRRGLEEQLPREMARVRRAESDLCLAIVDIDHFRDYNEANGHLAGDAVLRECAVVWDGVLRGADTIIRFGGEEFLVVLPDCPLAQAVDTVERLRRVTPGGLTCSAGLACWDHSESADDLVDRADSALYRAKAAGRDQLVQSPPIES